jgi:hypothetical protein
MVAIKDFGMPNVCYMCPILDGEYGRCKIIGETQCDMTEERAKGCPLVEAISKADYEARLQADIEAILVELQLEIEEQSIIDYDEDLYDGGECVISISEINDIIQQKINALKADQEGKNEISVLKRIK